MTAQHTPGPVSLVVDECLDARGFSTIRRSNGTPNGDTESEPIATVYVEPYASILAAAPALLAALRGAVAMLEIERRSHAESLDAKRATYCAPLEGAIAQYRAAIARATGEEVG